MFLEIKKFKLHFDAVIVDLSQKESDISKKSYIITTETQSLKEFFQDFDFHHET